MEKNKIGELIRHLPEKDIENVRSYFQSSLFFSKPEYPKLIDALIYNKNQFSKLIIWKSVFPKQKLDVQKFRKLCYEVLQATEFYLSIQHLSQDQEKAQQHLLNYYLENEINDFFEFKIDKIRLAKAEQQKHGAEIYLNKYLSEHLYFLYLQKKENIQTSLNIAASSDDLDKFYFSQKLKYICNTLNYKAILGKSEIVEFSDEIIILIEKSTLKNDALISTYLSIYYLLKMPEIEDNFHTSKRLLITYANDFVNSEFSDILQYLINYCIKKINQSNEIYFAELFDIYQIYLKKIQEKVFSSIRFKNIFLLALKMKKYDWALEFIDVYGNKLPKEQREATIAYNKARLYYDTKQFDKVLDTLLNLHHDEVQFNLISKVLIVKTFYEKNEIQFLENYMQSFKAYILRNKEMNAQNKQIHQNFLKMMKQLIKLEFRSKAAIEKYRLKIESYTNLPDKNWFLEKVEQL